MFLGPSLTVDRRSLRAWRMFVPLLVLGVVLPTQLVDPALLGCLLRRLPHPGDGFDLPSGRQLYDSAQLVAIPLGAAAFVQAAALVVTLVGILMLALLA